MANLTVNIEISASQMEEIADRIVAKMQAASTRPQVDPDHVMSVAEVAKTLNLSQQTVYGMLNKRQIPGFKTGKVWGVSHRALSAWMLHESQKNMPETF